MSWVEKLILILNIVAAPEASLCWDFDPINILCVDLYHHLRTKCYFGGVPQWVSWGRYPLVSSGRVRFKKLFVRWKPTGVDPSSLIVVPIPKNTSRITHPKNSRSYLCSISSRKRVRKVWWANPPSWVKNQVFFFPLILHSNQCSDLAQHPMDSRKLFVRSDLSEGCAEWKHISWSYTATHNTMQHTVTHCNPLQHTATHCNTLQHITTHCNTHILIFHSTHCSLISNEISLMTWVKFNG